MPYYILAAMRTVFIEVIIIIDTHVHKRWIIFRFFVHLLFDIGVADDKTQINLRLLSFAMRKIGIELASRVLYHKLFLMRKLILVFFFRRSFNAFYLAKNFDICDII